MTAACNQSAVKISGQQEADRFPCEEEAFGHLTGPLKDGTFRVWRKCAFLSLFGVPLDQPGLIVFGVLVTSLKPRCGKTTGSWPDRQKSLQRACKQ